MPSRFAWASSWSEATADQELPAEPNEAPCHHYAVGSLPQHLPAATLVRLVMAPRPPCAHCLVGKPLGLATSRPFSGSTTGSRILPEGMPRSASYRERPHLSPTKPSPHPSSEPVSPTTQQPRLQAQLIHIGPRTNLDIRRRDLAALASSCPFFLRSHLKTIDPAAYFPPNPCHPSASAPHLPPGYA